MKRLFNWLAGIFSPREAPPRPDFRQTGSQPGPPGLTRARRHPRGPALPQRQPDFVDVDPELETRIEDNGPGKNVLIRNKYVREDSGTHETLKILDESIIESDDESGLDPYNTGQFDRSKNWDKRFRS